jgi:undecaprenyl-diphosphatase
MSWDRDKYASGKKKTRDAADRADGPDFRITRTDPEERRGPESNRRVGVLQTPALPLGYRARALKLFPLKHFLNVATIPMTGSDRAPESRLPPVEGGLDTRGRARLFWDLVFGLVRVIFKRARNFYATFGIILLAGAALALGGTYVFAELAGHVTSGKTQQFDDSVLRWIDEHRIESLEHVMLEITFLGTGSVVITMVAVSALFLGLNRHKYSAALLLISTIGGILLNNLLKVGFGRPRPQIFDWGTEVVSLSFPSGHAMSSAVVYGTVAYLAARLQTKLWQRLLTFFAAALIIALISISRLYLGVHYPSDVAAGVVIGLAWAGFCMAMLEAIQLYGRNRAPNVARNEAPPPAQES